MKNGNNQQGTRIKVLCPHCETKENIETEGFISPMVIRCCGEIGGCEKQYVVNFEPYMQWCTLKIEVLK